MVVLIPEPRSRAQFDSVSFPMATDGDMTGRCSITWSGGGKNEWNMRNDVKLSPSMSLARRIRSESAKEKKKVDCGFGAHALDVNFQGTYNQEKKIRSYRAKIATGMKELQGTLPA